ncbi:MAG: ABC transporter ATPase [Flavobacteriales bacterium]|nr:ABC transporter ATPase [Flavobacteriales bacterium]
MNNNIQTLHDRARVWIYQSSREFTSEETQRLQSELDDFLHNWEAHGAPLEAAGTIEHDRFVVIAVDEGANAATGCSIDSSVEWIRKQGEKLGVDFFNRMAIAWMDDTQLKISPMHDFWAMRKAGLINDDTHVFNNLVKNLGEWRTGWITPFGQSWHAEMW